MRTSGHMKAGTGRKLARRAKLGLRQSTCTRTQVCSNTLRLAASLPRQTQRSALHFVARDLTVGVLKLGMHACMMASVRVLLLAKQDSTSTCRGEIGLFKLWPALANLR